METYEAMLHAAKIGDSRYKQFDSIIHIIPCIRASTSYTMSLCSAQSENMYKMIREGEKWIVSSIG